jgi:plasmid rolling circle replication initiator protein Rep
MLRSPPHEGQSPDELQLVEALEIEALPGRVQRYGQRKEKSLSMAEYIGTLEDPTYKTLGKRVEHCADYLAFRHYFTVDEVKLHGANFCMKPLLCPMCACRRGAKALAAYTPRYDEVMRLQPDLRPFLVTLTVKDGPDLAERFKHLHDSQRELWMRKHRGRGSPFDAVRAAVWSYEVKRGQGSGLWHPHLHAFVLADDLAPEDHADGTLGALSREWHEITRDSHMVNVKPMCSEDPRSGFCEVFKYAVKFSDMEHADTWHAYRTLKGRRLVGSAGLFRGIEIPDSLVDVPYDDLPYREFFYRYCFGKGYSLEARDR